MGNTYNPRAWDGVTPLNNGTADAGISAAEGQTAGSVNNGMRGIMSGVKNALDDIGGALVAGGTANAITLTTKQNLSAAHIAAGLTLSFRATATNTGATTLNPDTIGAVAIVDAAGRALSGGEIVSGAIITVMYNANTSKWILVSGYPTPGMFLLASGTVSSAATLDIVLTGYTRFRAIKFVLSGLRPATDAVELYARFSTNGGSSWISSGYNYAGTETIDGATTAAFGSGSASVIKLTSAASGGIGNGSNEGYNGEIELFNQTSGSFWPRIMFRGYHIDSAGTPGGHYTSGGGSNETAQDVDGLQLFVDTGNIAAMNYALYGYI